MSKFSKIIAATAVLTVAVFMVFSPISVNAQALSGGMAGGASAARGVDQPADLFGQTGIFTTITNVMLYAIGAISVIMVIIGGMRYVLSGGDSGNVATAKNTILYAIVGIIVALMAYAIVNFVISNFIGGSGGVSGFSGGVAGGASAATNF